MKMHKYCLTAALVLSPAVFTACKNGQDNAESADGAKLKDAETQMQALRTENDRLRQEVDNLKVTIAKLETKESQHTAQGRAADGSTRTVPPMPREKEAVREGATGGTSFK